MGCLCIYRNKNRTDNHYPEDILFDETALVLKNTVKKVVVKHKPEFQCSKCKRYFYTRENLYRHFWCFAKTEYENIEK